MAKLGIIGGTGLGETLAKEAGGRAVSVDTPFGPPSSTPIIADWGGVEVAFISRHGPGHTIPPSQVPYRANIWAMKSLGVTAILASGATGSLREECAPGDLVLCDQVIDKTFRRAGTFFDEGLAVHVELSEPFCPRLRAVLKSAGDRIDARVHTQGTYVCMEGPQFSTRAESLMHRMWGGDLIGMTCMPEAKLAREAELCYALIALPTDYDCWRRRDDGPQGEALLSEILGNLNRATGNAVSLIRETVGHVAERPVPCSCGEALKLAIWSERSTIDRAIKDRLGLLLSRHL